MEHMYMDFCLYKTIMLPKSPTIFPYVHEDKNDQSCSKFGNRNAQIEAKKYQRVRTSSQERMTDFE